MLQQYKLTLAAKSRGFHLVTDEIIRQIPALHDVDVGLLNLFIKHTSASLTINENADPTVRHDFEAFFNRNVPENAPYFKHNYEGPDDMPAHIKASLLGNNITLPISQGRLNMGTWQGIYLGEHRDLGGSRHLIATLITN